MAGGGGGGNKTDSAITAYHAGDEDDVAGMVEMVVMTTEGIVTGWLEAKKRGRSGFYTVHYLQRIKGTTVGGWAPQFAS